MESNFFRQLAGLNLRGNLILNIRVGDGDKIQVSALLRNPALKDKSADAITPMLLQGTPEEMDKGFYTSLKEPLLNTNTFFVNAIQHQESVKSAVKGSTSNNPPSNSAAGSVKRKFDEKMKKVTELESKNKIGEAIGQMPTIKEFPAHEKEITAKLNELKTKHGSFTLFDTPQGDQTDSSDESLSTGSEETEEPEDPEAEYEDEPEDEEETEDPE